MENDLTENDLMENDLMENDPIGDGDQLMEETNARQRSLRVS